MMREAAILETRAFSGFYGTISKMFIHLLTHFLRTGKLLTFFFYTDTHTYFPFYPVLATKS